MGSAIRVKNEDLLNGTTPDLSGNWSSEAIPLESIEDFSIQLIFTGAPVGSFKLQGSNDPGQALANTRALMSSKIVNWTDIGDSTQAIAASGDHLYTVRDAAYNWVRVVWTFSSGTGSITSARVDLKAI